MNQKREGEKLFEAWRNVEVPFDEDAGRSRFLESAKRIQAKPRQVSRALSRTGLLVAAAFALAITLFGIVLYRRAPEPLRFVAWGSFGTTPGVAQAWLATDPKSDLPLAFSEGTRVVISPDSRGRVEKLDPHGASFLLERGAVRAHVVHQRETDWRFLAGPFEVKVTGTELRVAWDPADETFSVAVDDGAVVVHGPLLGAEQVVRTGERCIVDLKARSMHLAPIAADVDSGAGAFAKASVMDGATDGATEFGGPDLRHDSDLGASPSAATSVVRTADSAPPKPRPWTAFEERGDYDAAYAAASDAGFASLYRASSADELLRLALVAQLSGHRSTEREALLACRRRFPSSEQGAVAAYELGRASSPSEATSWFDTYLREQPAGPLAREALGRLVEARAASGDDAGARDAATRYLARYPSGPEAPLARRVLSGSHP